MLNRIELSPFYYLGNFQKLLSFINKNYESFLNEVEVNFINDFKQLKKGSRCLLVRLLSRTGPLFNGNKLQYDEIPSIKKAITELKSKEFLLEINDLITLEHIELEFEDVLRIFTKDELHQFLSDNDIKIKKSSKKEEFISKIIKSNALKDKFLNENTILFPLHQYEIQKFLFLFFGNFEQSLSDFILEDIGVLKYEKVKLDSKNLPFKSKEEIDITMKFYDHFFSVYEWGELEELELALKEIKKLERIVKNNPNLRSKYNNALNYLAKKLESDGELNDALKLYKKSTKAPARERVVRILFKLEEFNKAKKKLLEIEEDISDSSEIEFLRVFTPKLEKALGLDSPKRVKETFNEKKIQLKSRGSSVEEDALDFYKSQGMDGFHLENTLWNSLFGLYFWDIIFTPLEKSFYNPFQRGPVDLFSGIQFYQRRKDLIDKRLLKIQKGKIKIEFILNLYDKKFKTANMLVSWNKVERAMIEEVLSRVDSKLLALIFERMLLSLRSSTSGFPDLFIYNNESYQLVEVKGPGDTLRPNQKEWMRFFKEINLNFSTLYIKY